MTEERKDPQEHRAAVAAVMERVAQLKEGFGRTLPIQPSRLVKPRGFEWDYEIQIALPGTYASSPEKSYPVLWLMDGTYSFHLTVGLLNYLSWNVNVSIPEMIVVAVGCPTAAGPVEFTYRRNIDFAPPGKTLFYDGPGGDLLRKRLGAATKGEQKGDAFLAFLVDEIRPQLAREYRMTDDHTLFGHSGGGMFASYAMFARPGGFRRYIIASPFSNAVDRVAFRLEEEYAKNNSDMKADIFFGAGEKEIGDLDMASFVIVSAPVLMAETLLLRQYPSLKVTTRIFAGKDHFTALPDLILEGLQAVWSRESRSV